MNPSMEEKKPVLVVRAPHYDTSVTEASCVAKEAKDIGLVKIPGGVYMRETDRPPVGPDGKSPCTTIYYMMTSTCPVGKMHYNAKGRSIHVVQKGRGVYVLIHPDGTVEEFVVGLNHARGEVSQFIVPPKVWKGCYILPGEEDKKETNEDILLASEVVVPGFDFQDMVMMDKDTLAGLVGETRAKQYEFML